MKPGQLRRSVCLVLIVGAVTAIGVTSPAWVPFLAGLWPPERLPARIVRVDYMSHAQHARLGGDGGCLVVRVEVPKLETWSRAAASTFGELRVGAGEPRMGVVWGDDQLRLGESSRSRTTPHAWFELRFSVSESGHGPESAAAWQAHLEGTAPLAVRVVARSMLRELVTTEWLDLSPFRAELAALLRAR